MRLSRTILAVALCSVLGLSTAACVSNAEAAPKYKATLYAVDGGQSQTLSLATAGRTVDIQCLASYGGQPQEICFKTGTATPLTVDCTQDMVDISNKKTTPLRVQLGDDTKIAIKSTDAGNPACNAFEVLFNPGGR